MVSRDLWTILEVTLNNVTKVEVLQPGHFYSEEGESREHHCQRAAWVLGYARLVPLSFLSIVGHFCDVRTLRTQYFTYIKGGLLLTLPGKKNSGAGVQTHI